MSWENPRLSLNDSMMDMFLKMAEGNPGAVRVCMDLLQQGAAIDPDSAFKGLGAIMDLDNHDLYGPKIWILYKDVCGERIPHMMAVLRACQLGLLPRREIAEAVATHGKSGLPVDDIYAKVRERLPAFDAVNQTPPSEEDSEKK